MHLLCGGHREGGSVVSQAAHVSSAAPTMGRVWLLWKHTDDMRNPGLFFGKEGQEGREVVRDSSGLDLQVPELFPFLLLME